MYNLSLRLLLAKMSRFSWSLNMKKAHLDNRRDFLNFPELYAFLDLFNSLIRNQEAPFMVWAEVTHSIISSCWRVTEFQ